MRLLTLAALAIGCSIAWGQQTPIVNSGKSAAQAGTAGPVDSGAAKPKVGPAANQKANPARNPAASQKASPEANPAANSVEKSAQMATAGEDFNPHIKKGSEEDVNAVGHRKIGGRGMRNWYSTKWEISTGTEYSMEIDRSSHLVSDPVVVAYINRIGQNLVKNSDAKVPFTIKVLDSDEINAMALPGGYLYVNSGLILACDSEDELAGVMAHEIAHVAAHHAAREMTKLNLMQVSSVPLMIFTQGTWTAYGIYEAAQLSVPLTFLQFSRKYEAEADYLGIQYMYKAGYDPQGMVTIFEKLSALEKHKRGAVSRAFSGHPATPDRIAAVEHEIATILPPRTKYVVTTPEFNQVKARLEHIEQEHNAARKKAVPVVRGRPEDPAGGDRL